MGRIDLPQTLWIAPNLNHYKIRFLSKLAKRGVIHLSVLAGRPLVEFGHSSLEDSDVFQRIDVTANRNNFAYHFEVYAVLTKLVRSRSFDVILMPAERKFLPLIIYLRCMSITGRYRLVTYNHPMTGMTGRPLTVSAKAFVRFIFFLYDRIIFYTEKGRERAIAQELVREDKAYFANNTLDTSDIWNHYAFEVNDSKVFTLLFIGRLVPRRRLDVLFDYFQELKKLLPDVRLVMIGDGPQSTDVKQMVAANSTIEWLGAIVDEKRIAEEMRRAHIVFMPGDSGLSVAHAFCYGKPYVTLSTCPAHGPEIDYLVDQVNGCLLSGERDSDCARIADLLLDRDRYQAMCTAAFNTARALSVELWCEKIEEALTF